MKQKKAKSFCITENIKDLVKYIAERDDYTKTAMYKRALRIFFEQGEGVSSRVLITDRSDPDYIPRNTQEVIYLDLELAETLEKHAKAWNCSEGQIVFQALINYCAERITEDDTGIQIEERGGKSR